MKLHNLDFCEDNFKFQKEFCFRHRVCAWVFMIVRYNKKAEFQTDREDQIVVYRMC
jgi:hypothetical protein